jgi:hypothetical protein
MDHDAVKLIHPQHLGYGCSLIANVVKDDPAKPGEGQGCQETSDGEKPDRKTDVRYRAITGDV